MLTWRYRALVIGIYMGVAVLFISGSYALRLLYDWIKT